MEITKELNNILDIDECRFKHVGKKLEMSEVISRPSLSYWQDAWRRLKKNKIAAFSMILIIIYVILSIIGPYMTEYDYRTTNPAAINQSMSSKHWFGTDSLGRDLWARVWTGSRISLMIGLIATLMNSFIGVIIGGIAGYKGKMIDMIIMRTIDILYGIPYIIVAILVMIILGPGLKSLIVAMVITGWIGSARLIRGQVLQLKEQEFVSAAKLLGVSNTKIIFRHIVPNIMGLIVTSMTFAIPGSIFTEAFLSYIGIGIQPPECSLGSLAKMGSTLFKIYPYQLFIPASVICILMLSFSLFGDGLRDALDPKLRGLEK